MSASSVAKACNNVDTTNKEPKIGPPNYDKPCAAVTKWYNIITTFNGNDTTSVNDTAHPTRIKEN